MPTRAIYETTVDEDVYPDSNANPCPECGDRVTTNAVGTVCDDCGLVIDSAPEWQNQSAADREQYGPPAVRGTVSADE
ncbi:transcription initiation factor TFIIIB, Brf1 subunit/transcription initiation factor TFIIB [Candidatus Halobonum tyrrellensis G22]|uniref:Transcription initiation factor TFIIIB, Brf1 subunit/transcription initiation factor TFIIB n=1 Tax=Candidatus Halobonum tyrrellensis G22 TaxID=1324957 RepID=V4HIV9_9EURY|nr:transcription initiation factor TFIIIB, Brf1 subunit/transcription initiation factor TFIIB [Candidatus Halobonum tyrrellensis]ESP89728.1 transcription initiation factor TFIIIB, Brf1 subunit/transcription initiation factor TFIIB [Candidatus Halobonum tyrrellensis G22]